MFCYVCATADFRCLLASDGAHDVYTSLGEEKLFWLLCLNFRLLFPTFLSFAFPCLLLIRRCPSNPGMDVRVQCLMYQQERNEEGTSAVS